MPTSISPRLSRDAAVPTATSPVNPIASASEHDRRTTLVDPQPLHDIDRLFERWSTGSRIVDPNKVPAEIRGAAELIADCMGRSAGCLRERDLAAAERVLHRFEEPNGTCDLPKRWRDVDPCRIQAMRDKLPALVAELHLPAPKAMQPFCLSFLPSAIVRPTLRRCAEIVARLDPTRHEVTTAGLVRAREEMNRILEGAISGEMESLLQDPADREAFTNGNLQLLEIFAQTGKGGVTHAGRVSINGREFDEVHRLHEGELSPSDLSAFVKHCETRFGGCGFDRIYIIDPKKQLLLALNPFGSLSEVQPEMRVECFDPESGRAIGSGTVLFVSDINNSLHEATLGFWSQLPTKVTQVVRKMTGESSEDRIEKILAESSTLLAPEAEDKDKGKEKSKDKDSKGPAIANWFLAGGVSATLGTIAVSAPTAAAFLGAVTGVVTLVNVGEYLRNSRQRDKSTIYHAIGITPGRRGPFRD